MCWALYCANKLGRLRARIQRQLYCKSWSRQEDYDNFIGTNLSFPVSYESGFLTAVQLLNKLFLSLSVFISKYGTSRKFTCNFLSDPSNSMSGFWGDINRLYDSIVSIK